jgi:acyl transferase domain-containing protein/NADPH:quinone reductase-like Zn-dependent oxidoreductase/NADP-dependent 3-hydroxy acid dehydrogenase YdfG/acyl carrier protein
MGTIEPIAIVGIGCRLPGGVRGPDTLWKLLAGSVDAITEIPEDRWDIAATYHEKLRSGRMNTRWGGFLDNIDRFDEQFFGVSPREAAASDPQHRLLLEVVYEAVEDAGLTLAALAGRCACVHVGITTSDYSVLQLGDRAGIDAYTNAGSSACIAANRISYVLDLRGPSLAVDTACSSSLVATHLACESIWNGQSELAFAAGVNLMLRPEPTIGFSQASMLSPDGRCKSFDARANGYVRGEGVGVIVLKPLARARADRDRIYALIRATAVNQDGRTEGISVPNGGAQEANLRAALRLADLPAASVQYVEAHGTGTPVGDPIEAAALGAVYGRAQPAGQHCVIGSVKSNLGHQEAAAGIVGLIKAALCMQRRQIPASLHFEIPNPRIAFDELRLRVARTLEPWPETRGQPPRAGVNSFGFGGTNAHAILEALPAPNDAQARAEACDERAWLLPLSARSVGALSDLAGCYLDALRDPHRLQEAAVRNICFSASVRRSHHEFRATFVAHGTSELIEHIETFVQSDGLAEAAVGRRPGESPKPVFVCSGMGQQWWAMGRELLAQEPVFRRALAEISDQFKPLTHWSLLDQLDADEASSRINDTDVAQPTIFALQVALAALWRSWGVEPAAVLGHSAGEMAAAFIAGALSLEDAVKVTFHRSRLQRRTAGRGTMLAAAVSGDEAARLVEAHRRAISVAAINGPRSVTFSGDASVLEDVDRTFRAEGIFSRQLQVEVPFHSPVMDELEIELIASLRDIRPRPASVPFFSTVDGAVLFGPELDAQYWFCNVRKPVLFLDTMRAVIASGHHTFLEISAHPVLRRDIGDCASAYGGPCTTLASLRRGAPERATMLQALGALYEAGADIDWPKLFPADAAMVDLPLYPFQPNRHWRESEHSRRSRLGQSIHPLLGRRRLAPEPSWHVTLDPAELPYLADHRIDDSPVFPGAGYVEMALAAAREIFGPVPCVVEDIEFRKLLLLDEEASCSAQVTLDATSCDFKVHARGPASGESWELHARGCVRPASLPAPANVDLARISARCPVAIDPQVHYRLFADLGLNYGPAFRRIVHLSQGEREVLAEIRTLAKPDEQSPGYRLHPTALDCCLQSLLSTLPEHTVRRTTHGRAFVIVKIERVRFHASPGERLFASARVTRFGPTELTAEIALLDETGKLLVELEGISCQPMAQRRREPGALYEQQWKLVPRLGLRAWRDSSHLPWPKQLAPALQHEAERLYRRFDRDRYEQVFGLLTRAAAAGYIVAALRALGWRPETDAAVPISTLAASLGVAPHHEKWLALIQGELTTVEKASTAPPQRLWKLCWDEFTEGQAETLLLRQVGENLPAVLRGEIDPLQLVFSEGGPALAEFLYQDSPTFRLNNLLMQKAISEIVQRAPRSKTLRILEIGSGTGGTTSSVLPVLPADSTEYVLTDVSLQLVAHAQHKFAQYPFVQCRALDIERDPVEQGFEEHSFDIIIASDVLHATRDLRHTLAQVTRLLGSEGLLIFLEVTRPTLITTLIFGLLKGWWQFDDDVRQDQPTISRANWKDLLHEAGYRDVNAIADSPNADSAQHCVFLAHAPRLDAPADAAPPPVAQPSNAWLVFCDVGSARRPSAGARLSRLLRQRGDRVVEVVHGDAFDQIDTSRYSVRAGNPDDAGRLIGRIAAQSARWRGIVHLWSLDIEIDNAASAETLRAATRLGCISVMDIVRSYAVAGGMNVDAVWLVTCGAQTIGARDAAVHVAQSPLWGFGRVMATEYKDLQCRLVDLTTGSTAEITSLAEELMTGDEAEDELLLDGELRYGRRLVRLSPTMPHGTGQRAVRPLEPFRIEAARPGILESISARRVRRALPGPDQVEIEVETVGLNFKDLMIAMGLLPKEALPNGAAGGVLGLECAGRVVTVGAAVAGLAVGDEVLAIGTGLLASHITVDARFVAPKPRHLSFEEAATIPSAFSTAFYALHTLGNIQLGERVLIHAASGGVGLAAVQLALRAGAIVYATAGSPDKRALLSALGVALVMDSRSLAFADEVMKATGGEGVDLVLNSLAGEAIDKSLAILREFGRFVEIGLTDIYNDRKMRTRALRKNVSLFAVDLSSASRKRPALGRSLFLNVMRGFDSGELRPLASRVFPAGRTADALRHMAQAKHVGKIVVAMTDAAGVRVEDTPGKRAIEADAIYLITGGLGGFGLALAERLAQRGARRLALVGRNPPSESAQNVIARLERRGVEVMITLADVADYRQAERAMAAAQAAMGPLRGIVHAAMVLDDAPIERQTEERMWKAMAPKIMGAWNLHQLTAEADLDFFILFSSFAAITGSPGQSNYAAGNAFLDTLAFHRRARGLPALSVNWGMVGTVGHVANNQDVYQRLSRLGIGAIPASDMLDALDELMQGDAVQVGVGQFDWKAFLSLTRSRLPARFAHLVEGAEESAGDGTLAIRDILEADDASLPTLLELYIRDHLARAMGSTPQRIDPQQSLLDLGFDSLMAVQIRNRISADLGMNIPISTFKHGVSTRDLAVYVAEQLRQADRPKSAVREVGAEPGANIVGNCDTGAVLLKRVDELTDDEVDHHLTMLATQDNE